MTETEHSAGPARTNLDKRWVVRMLLITVVLWAFGGWAFYDATIKYPAKGKAAAEDLELRYLEEVARTRGIYDAPVVDPVGELAELRGRELLDLSSLDAAKLEWLKALATPGLGLLNPEHTKIADPQAELDRLREIKDTKGFPPMLSPYDIIVQWAICAICWALGLVMIVLFASVKSKVYRWDGASKTLTLPGNRPIAPADLDPKNPVDLAKWNKFLVFLRPRPGHERFPGPIKLDVFRYEPLEDWVKVLVKAVDPDLEFPDEAKARLEAERTALNQAAPADGEPSGDHHGSHDGDHDGSSDGPSDGSKGS
ncbi:MAG: hypothetical protein IT431_03090 [Phycisphaerales bacterium]|nr:hypothetical protein [Phycisphaerales bacterium]